MPESRLTSSSSSYVSSFWRIFRELFEDVVENAEVVEVMASKYQHLAVWHDCLSDTETEGEEAGQIDRYRIAATASTVYTLICASCWARERQGGGAERDFFVLLPAPTRAGAESLMGPGSRELKLLDQHVTGTDLLG